MPLCLLPDRGIVSLTGDDAESLLNRLVTNSVVGMAAGEARYAALLSPQGKLLFDFLVLRRPDGFWLDCRRDQAPDLAKKLTMFRLRAKAAIEDLSSALSVAACWDAPPPETSGECFRDPRAAAMGDRIIAPHGELAVIAASHGDYEAHRIACGVPEGGSDWTYGDTFVHDANLDLLNGVDFGKGCYVGQEVVSRVHHRSSARKRVVKIEFFGEPAPAGTLLAAGPLQIGVVTSIAERAALATARTDRLQEAASNNCPVLAGETLVGITLPTRSTAPPRSHAEATA